VFDNNIDLFFCCIAKQNWVAEKKKKKKERKKVERQTRVLVFEQKTTHKRSTDTQENKSHSSHSMANVANSGGTGTSSAPHLTVEEWRVKLDTWVARLDAHLPADYVPIDIDVSLDSGGFRGYYMAPAMHFLQKSRRYRVVRVAGASAGAAGACGLVCNIDVPKYISMFHSRYQPQVLQQGRPILDVFHDIVTDLFPANAHELCHGRVFISVHEIMPLSWSRLSWRGGGLEHQCITDFPTFDDLLQVMKCSMTVSKITTSQNAHLYNGRSYLDGIKPLLPCDPTAIGRLHMFIDLHRLPYPGTWMMSPRDPNIDNLTERGMIDFEQFLAVEDTHGSGTSHNRETNQSPIYWIHPERTAFMSPTTTSSTGCTPVTVGAGAGAAAATASAGPGLDGEFLPSATSTAPSSS